MPNFLNARGAFSGVFALVTIFGILSPAMGQLIDRVETEFDGFGGVSGITGAFDAVVSPDGQHVYVIGSQPIEGGSIAVFSRDDATGEVTFLEKHLDDGLAGGTVDGLRSARSVAISPDGKHVYVASLTDNAVVVFSRNTMMASGDFGKLTYVETHKDGQAPVDGLGGAHGITVSPDGEHVYVATRGEDAVAVFSRDDTTGALTFVEFHQNNVAGVSGLQDAERLTVSPDGKHVYVASEAQNAPGSVAVFERNTDGGSGDFGKLTFVEAEVDGVGGADGLAEANGVDVSPDGMHVYVSNKAGDDSDDWIGIFSRDAATGALTFVSKLTAGAADLCESLFGIDFDNEVVVSPDGKSVVASNSWKGSVVSFGRDAVTGALTIADQECDEASTEGLTTVDSVTFSPDGNHIYATGLGAPASLVVLTGIEITVEFQNTGVEIPAGDTTPSDSANEGTDFGALDPAAGSEERTFEIRNDGLADLDLTGPTPVTIAGGGAAHFGLTQPAALTLAPGEVTAFTITFDPSANGVHLATVSIGSNDPDENPYDFDVTGTGAVGDPDITVEFQDTGIDIPDGDATPTGPDAEGTDFGKFLTAAQMALRTFEIRNDGIVNLNLTGPDPVALDDGGAAQFAVTQPGVLVLAPDQSAAFTVTFGPTVDGTHVATVNIVSNDPDESPFDYRMTGINRAAERASIQRSISRLKKKIRRLSKRLRNSRQPATIAKIKKLKKKLRRLRARLLAL